MTKNLSSNFVVRIFPLIEPETFPTEGLKINKQNLKDAFRFPFGLGEEEREFLQVAQHTPFYNQSILEDMFMVEHLKLIHAASKSCEGFASAIILLKTWLRQKGLSSPKVHSFNGFLITLVTCHLLNIRKLNKSMSCYQIFKLVIKFLSELDIKAGIFWQDGEAPMSQQERQELLSTFDFVFVVPGSTLNVATHVSKSGLLELKRQANGTIQEMNSLVRNSFEQIFLSKPSPLLKFDHVIG